MLDRGLKVEITENSGYYSCLFLWALFSILIKSTVLAIFPWINILSRLNFGGSIVIIGIRYVNCIKRRYGGMKIVPFLIIFSSIMSMYCSGREEVFTLMLFVVCAVDIDIEQAIKALFFGELIGTVLIVVLSCCGIIENYTYTVERGIRLVTRYSMGFAHPNMFAIIVFQLMMCIIYLKRKKTGLLGNLILIFAAYALYSITYSRTIFLVSLGIAVYNIIGIVAELFQGNIFWNFMTRSIVRFLIIVGCVGSIYVALTYKAGNTLVEFITRYEAARPLLISDAMNYYKFTLFGQKVNLILSSEVHNTVGAYAVLDNAYIFLLLEFGITNTLWILGLYLFGINKIKYSNFSDYRIEILMLCMVGYLVIAITEKYSFDLFYNYTLFIIAYQMYGDIYQDDDEASHLFEKEI